MSLSSDPELLFGNALAAYQFLKEEKLSACSYLACAALQIAKEVDPDFYEDTAKRTKAIYNRFKSKHRMLTGQDDYVYAALLALSDWDDTRGLWRVDVFYNRLKDDFPVKNSVQTLAQVLALSGMGYDDVWRVLALRDAFANEDIKMSRANTVPALGVLAMLPGQVEEITAGFCEIRDALVGLKAFTKLSSSTQEAVVVVSAIQAKRLSMREQTLVGAALSSSLASIIAAQQTAMIATITASSAFSATMGRV